MGTIIWFCEMLIHVLYAGRFISHVNAISDPEKENKQKVPMKDEENDKEIVPTNDEKEDNELSTSF